MTMQMNDATAPTPAQWGQEEHSPDLYRGFFGGVLPGDSPQSISAAGGEWTGNIEFTGRAGTAIQDIFYSEAGAYYNFLCVYPYRAINDAIGNPNAVSGWSTEAGVKGYFKIDGNDDIMVSSGGSGNIDNPFGKNHDTDPTDGTVTFHHKLTALRCKFVAESAVALGIYGSITGVALLDQPDIVSIDFGAAFDDPAGTGLVDERENGDALNFTDAGDATVAVTIPVSTIAYPAVSETAEAGSGDVVGVARNSALPLPEGFSPTTDAVDYGYVLALPATTYTFSITTSGLGSDNPLVATYDFSAASNANPLAKPSEGTIYNLTFVMTETAEIILTAAEASEWWLEQTFD
jgi:hypothetical protein